MSSTTEGYSLTVLGKVIGTYATMETVSDIHELYNNFIPNTLGTQFIEASGELCTQSNITLDIDFLEGIVVLHSDIPDLELGPTKINWAVFNTPAE